MILITGFEPFGKWTTNTALWAALAAGEAGGGVRSMILPVSYQLAAARLVQEIDDSAPEMVISIGMAGKRATVDVETLAHNEDRTELADSDGVIRSGTPIFDGGLETLTPSFPRVSLVEYLRGAGYLAGLSSDAGRYVCNNLFYTVAAALSARESETPFTFVHIPGPLLWKEPVARKFGRVLAQWALEQTGSNQADPHRSSA